MNESLISFVTPIKSKSRKCAFCTKESTKNFGFYDISNPQYNPNTQQNDAYLFKSYALCDDHIKVINQLFTGEKNIENLIIRETATIFNLRG